ncbi:hypothetical protein V6N11_033101 [Hibiscus sabdariffa]|uniref:Uncharacterized protein n=1 Tax=Hibiscus sabdariffa TaxID=183260 RepID=A0ABR2A1E0_9ROSI
MGENASQIQNCESLSLLIATDQEEFINEVVGVEVGSELFHVRASDLYPWILETRLLKTGDRPIMSTPLPESEESSSVEVESKNVLGASDGNEVLESKDAFNVLFVGKEDLFNTWGLWASIRRIS